MKAFRLVQGNGSHLEPFFAAYVLSVNGSRWRSMGCLDWEISGTSGFTWWWQVSLTSHPVSRWEFSDLFVMVVDPLTWATRGCPKVGSCQYWFLGSNQYGKRNFGKSKTKIPAHRKEVPPNYIDSITVTVTVLLYWNPDAVSIVVKFLLTRRQAKTSHRYIIFYQESPTFNLLAMIKYQPQIGRRQDQLRYVWRHHDTDITQQDISWYCIDCTSNTNRHAEKRGKDINTIHDIKHI